MPSNSTCVSSRVANSDTKPVTCPELSGVMPVTVKVPQFPPPTENPSVTIR